MTMKRLITGFILALMACAVGTLPVERARAAQDDVQAAKVTRFYVVRHAEKVDDSRDPELSEAGKQRAQDLAERLKDAEIGAAYTTPYIRTRETARPTADARQLELQEFPPQQPGEAAKAWAKELLAVNKGKNVLIVAHSGRPDQRGSVPSLVTALSGAEDIAAITDGEYFNLYIVTVTTEEDATQIDVKREKYGVVPDDQADG